MSRLSLQRRKLTVPQLASQWGVASKKIIAFIRDGELRATNLASRGTTRPRYAIDVDDVAAFERARQVVPTVPSTQRLRRRAAANVKEFV